MPGQGANPMLSGGCLCGALRFRTEARPKFVTLCYCTDCQKESGAGHLTLVAVSGDSLAVEGTAATFMGTADSGLTVSRTFCPACGTTILGHPQSLAGLAMVRAGTLDGDHQLTPNLAIFTASAPSWDQPPEGLRSFPGMPPARDA